MEHIIPLFACTDLDRSLTYYQALGFAVTYRQDRPYWYAAINRGAVTLHMAKRARPATSLVMTTGIGTLHHTFAAGLRAYYGSIPTAGFPRLTRLRPGQTRFHLFDPGGNCLLYIDQDEPDSHDDDRDGPLTPLAQALGTAAFLRDTYADDQAAARVLDTALARHRDADVATYGRALAARAELAVALGDLATSAHIAADLQGLPMIAADRQRFADELAAAPTLARWIHG